MINKHKSNKIKENSNTVRHLNNGTDHRHSKSCCDQSSPARRTIMDATSLRQCLNAAVRMVRTEGQFRRNRVCHNSPNAGPVLWGFRLRPLNYVFGIFPTFSQYPLDLSTSHLTDVTAAHISMMTSSNGNIFRVTGHLCGEFTGPRWIPRTKASVAELWCLLWSASE